jgi:hypothetical protein
VRPDLRGQISRGLTNEVSEVVGVGECPVRRLEVPRGRSPLQGKPALGAGGRRGRCRRRPTSRHHNATENRPPLQPLRRSSSFVVLDATAADAGSSSICPDAAAPLGFTRETPKNN